MPWSDRRPPQWAGTVVHRGEVLILSTTHESNIFNNRNELVDRAADRLHIYRAMHVLMITPRVDPSHDVLGFTTDWIAALADRVGELSVLSGYVGDWDPPDNVRLRSYGKENGLSKPRRVLRFQRHCRSLARDGDVDIVFAHMIPKFTLASWLWFGARGVPYLQWYAHSSVTWDLRLVTKLVDTIVTPTSESFRIDTPKLDVLGHGIDTDRFTPGDGGADRTRLLGVGRIDPVKRFDLLVDAVHELVKRDHDVTLRIVGGSTGDREYTDEIRAQVSRLGLDDRVTFVGAIPHEEIVAEYRRAGAFINGSQTGSLDKTEIEALACGTPTISCNDSYREMVRREELSPSLLSYPADDAAALAACIEGVLQLPNARYEQLCQAGRDTVVANHDVGSLMGAIASRLERLAAPSGGLRRD